MGKSFIKDINLIIMDIENCDYICGVRYVIFFISRILYSCKLRGFNILSNNFSNYKLLVNFHNDDANVFSDYEEFNLHCPSTEEKLYNLISANKDQSFLHTSHPAEFYELLLTSKEKKTLGQVYTPNEIITKMLDQIFTIKAIDKTTRILDPSCGGGYFLIELFKRIKKQFSGQITDKYIIENMIYGIDIDDFSIFLSKVGLLFMSNLNHVNFNIFNMDFLIDSINMDKFDIIVGNPPYVGHKNSSTTYKKTLYENYPDVFYDKADISYCFFRKSNDLLAHDGIISFITSRYFMEALYADRLRKFLKKSFSIVCLQDYGGNKVFKDAMVSPAVVTLSNIVRNKNDLLFVKYNEHWHTSETFNYNQDKLSNSGWIILRSEEEQLFKRIESISNSYVKDLCTIKQGIITGLDKAFIVNDEIIEKYNIESYLLKKWIKNSNIR
ncbi:MAG: class I SAM-dependent DNA methyltransferase, partial [Sedimentibacter sp.]